MAGVYTVASWVGFVLAGVFLVLAAVWFFRYNIVKIIGDLSGINARKSIAAMGREQKPRRRAGNQIFAEPAAPVTDSISGGLEPQKTHKLRRPVVATRELDSKTESLSEELLPAARETLFGMHRSGRLGRARDAGAFGPESQPVRPAVSMGMNEPVASGADTILLAPHLTGTGAMAGQPAADMPLTMAAGGSVAPAGPPEERQRDILFASRPIADPGSAVPETGRAVEHPVARHSAAGDDGPATVLPDSGGFMPDGAQTDLLENLEQTELLAPETELLEGTEENSIVFGAHIVIVHTEEKIGNEQTEG